MAKWMATYVHHPGRQIGTVLATSAGSAASTGTWAYYFQDAIGSTRGLWDDAGDRLGKYEYTPFGGKYADAGEDITRKFTGHDWDKEARLYYTAYRYYSPDANRWLTRDPLGMVDGPNVYAYVRGNPVSFWDALGQCGTKGTGQGFIAQNPLTTLMAVGCLVGIALAMYFLAQKFGGKVNSVGATALACMTCIVSAVLWYSNKGWDPATHQGGAVAALLGFGCFAACITTFIAANVLSVQVLAVGIFGRTEMTIIGLGVLASYWPSIVSTGLLGLDCGAVTADLASR